MPRRQLRRFNAHLEFLGEAAEIVVHPNDAAAAGVSDEQRLIARSALGELTGVARGWLRPLAVARSRCRMGMQAPTSICIDGDDVLRTR